MAHRTVPLPQLPQFPQEHVCTPESCPPVGGYYVSAVDSDTYWLIAGPYQTHAEALADKNTVFQIANRYDSRAWFKSWGTCRVKEGELKPGALNRFNLMPPRKEATRG